MRISSPSKKERLSEKRILVCLKSVCSMDTKADEKKTTLEESPKGEHKGKCSNLDVARGQAGERKVTIAWSYEKE